MTVYETSESGAVLGKDDLAFGRNVLTLAPFGTIYLPLSSYLRVGPSIELEIRNNNDEFLVAEELLDRWKSVHLRYFIAIGKDFASKRNSLFIEAAINLNLGNFYDSEDNVSDGALSRIVEHSANITIGMRI